MKNIILTLLGLLFIISTGIAQGFFPAEIYTLEGQTIRGFIKNQGKQENCINIQFKTSSSSEVSKYVATDLKGYAIDDKAVYRAAKVNLAGESEDFTRDVFLQTLVKGDVNLYRLDFDVQKSNTPFVQYQDIFYFLKKQDEEAIMLIVEGAHQNQIKTYFERFCKKDVEQVNDNYRYRDTGLARIINNYNEACSTQSTEVLISLESRKRKFKLGGGIGIYQTEIRNNSSKFSDFVPENGTGINLHFLVETSVIQRLSFQVSAAYQSLSSHGTRQFVVNEFYINEGEVIELKSEMDFQYLNALANLKYRFLPKKMSPYIFGGLHYGFGLNNSVSLERPDFTLGSSDNVASKKLEEEPFGSVTLGNEDLGWQAGIGIDYQLSEKLTLYAAYQYQQGKTNVVKGSSLLFENSLQGINIGVQF